MNMSEVRNLAKEAGIPSFGKTKADLIRAIQRQQGHFDCFGSVREYCDQLDCCFRAACFAVSRKTGRRQDAHKQA